jgi:hypothetical protein
VAALLCLLPTSVSAQAHPCDSLPPSSATVTEGSVRVGWCHDRRDLNGSITPLTGWVIYSNGARTALTTVTTTNVANAAGLVYYETVASFPRGNYTLTVAAVNGSGEGLISAPFALSVNAAPAVPRAPGRVRAS